MPPVITALYGALNAIFNIFLANNVSTKRRRGKISLGEGNDPSMLVAIRAHANNAEFVPLAIVVMLLLEMCAADRVALHVYGGLLLAARISHWIGLPRKSPNPFRFGGTAITWTLIVAGAAYLLFLRFRITGAI